MDKAKFGVIGLAVMGANIARNSARHQKTIVYNRTTEKTDEFIKEFGNENLVGSKTLEEFTEALETPRKILIMVKSGDPVDTVISQLTPLLDKGDIIIDGGNSHYSDTARRQKELQEKGIHFIGMGISGGEEGALNGPSMMPGGEKEAYESIEEILKPMAAEDGASGRCITYIGEGESGHFVKMVHNGIEYALMQLIAESYDILKNLGNCSNEQLSEIFEKWSKTENLKSFLIEITAKIFAKNEDGIELIDVIKDAAKQKGTGKWTTFAAMDFGVSTPTINAAVDARIMSGSINIRARKYLPKHTEKTQTDNLEEIVKDALIQSTLLSYFQGMELLKASCKEMGWTLDLGEIARIWRGGCIIRADILEKLQAGTSTNEEEAKNSKLQLLKAFGDPAQTNWRKLMSITASNGIPTPGMSASLAYYDSILADHLPQNLTQAQRDFFGAHTYERTDREGSFHTDWE